MPKGLEVTPLDSSDLGVEQVPSDQGDTKILGDNSEEEMHNISFDESQYRLKQSCTVSTLDDKTSPMWFEEWVIVSDVRKHPYALVDATKAYAKATNSSVRFLIAENERMAKELQVAK